MKIGLVGLPGSGKTTLFNALSDRPVDLLPGVPGSAPHVSVVPVRDVRLEWLRDLYSPKKYTPAALIVEDHAGIPPGSARSDRRGELFAQMRNAEGIVVVLRAFSTDRYAYDDPTPDPARDLELVALEFLSADLEICERRLERLKDDWRNPKQRERVEREQVVVERVVEALHEGRGAHTLALHPTEEALLKGFQLLTLKPTVLMVNRTESAEAPEVTTPLLRVEHHFDACLQLEADLKGMDAEEREMFAAEYGITELLTDRFNLACYRGLGLLSFFTVGEDEVRAWTIEAGDNAVIASGKIHTDLARGFIRAEVTPYDDLHALGAMREVKAAGKQRLEGRDYEVQDGDILNVRFSA